jgi:cytochrome c oxidase subunit 4
MTDTAAAAPAADHDEHHPSDRHYVNIAVALALITGLEVAWSYTHAPTVLFVGVLMTLMAIKFFMVASQFMHLKFDNKILTRLFYGGLFLAVGVYLIALFTFRIFNL